MTHANSLFESVDCFWIYSLLDYNNYFYSRNFKKLSMKCHLCPKSTTIDGFEQRIICHSPTGSVIIIWNNTDKYMFDSNLVCLNKFMKYLVKKINFTSNFICFKIYININWSCQVSFMLFFTPAWLKWIEWKTTESNYVHTYRLSMLQLGMVHTLLGLQFLYPVSHNWMSSLGGNQISLK